MVEISATTFDDPVDAMFDRNVAVRFVLDLATRRSVDLVLKVRKFYFVIFYLVTFIISFFNVMATSYANTTTRPSIYCL
jgi:hypothetical protein